MTKTKESGSYKYKPIEMTTAEQTEFNKIFRYQSLSDAELESKLTALRIEFNRREGAKKAQQESVRVCHAEKHQLGSGWKLLILGIFLMLMWQVANPHYITAQHIYVSRPTYIGFQEYSRDVPYTSICTNDTAITDLVYIKTRWVRGGECAWLAGYPKLVLFQR